MNKNLDNLKLHCSTSDFTINSMACDINGNIIDFFDGQKDIKDKCLRFVGEAQDRIEEDPLRLMRMLRLANKYKMECPLIGLDTFSKILILSKERIREELLKILSIPHLDADTLFYLFRVLFPFYEKSLSLEGGDHHDETVGDHLMYSLKEACKVTENPLLRLEVFAHDCGKYRTVSYDFKSKCCEAKVHEIDTGVLRAIQYNCTDCGEILQLVNMNRNIHFYQHHKIGADIMRAWMKEYKFSKEEIKYLTTIVYHHMHGYNINQGKKSYIKLFASLEEAKVPIEDFVIQMYCDNQGNQAKPRIKLGDFIKNSIYIKKYFELKHSDEPFKITELVIKGKDLIERFKIQQGPELGKILGRLHNLVMEGELKNQRGELLNWVRTNVIVEEGAKKRDLVIFVGIPGAGKTHHYINNYLGSHVHINLDTLKTRAKEWRVFTAAVESNLPIVIDNTNVTKELRKRYIDHVKGKYNIKCVYFCPSKELCLKRNAERDRTIPESAIERFNNEMEEPSTEEGFSEIETRSVE